MTSIFVAKLDFGVSEEELKDLFAEYGTVNKAHIAKDRETGKPRGFAFVEMADSDEAQAAIDGLNDMTINGRQIAVKEAEQRENNRPSPRPRTENTTQRPSRTSDFSGNEGTPPQVPEEPKSFAPRRGKKGVDKPSGGDNRKKKPKMAAHKKSGKNKRLRFDDEDDDYNW